jgi:hypothetical protein
MLTVEHMRHAVATSGPMALDYTSQDIQSALANVRAFMDAGIPHDTKRASEYADELAIVAQVRREITGRKPCPCCGKI